MENEILVAIIAAGGVVLAAIIAGVFNLLKKDSASSNGTNIHQSQKGRNSTQIGVQNIYDKEDR